MNIEFEMELKQNKTKKKVLYNFRFLDKGKKIGADITRYSGHIITGFFVVYIQSNLDNPKCQ